MKLSVVKGENSNRRLAAYLLLGALVAACSTDDGSSEGSGGDGDGDLAAGDGDGDLSGDGDGDLSGDGDGDSQGDGDGDVLGDGDGDTQGDGDGAGGMPSGTGGTQSVDGCTNLTDGWTDLTPGENTQIYYVSSSEGSDENGGLSEDDALASLPGAVAKIRAAAGVASGEAAIVDAHLLLKRGDEFAAGFGNFTIHGESAARPFIVSTYGSAEDPRPIITDTLFVTQGGGGVETDVVTSNVTFVGLHAYAKWRDPNSPDFEGDPGVAAADGPDGFTVLRSFENILMEDMVFQSFAGLAVSVGAVSDTHPMGRGLVMRRSLVLDNYQDRENGHSQGIYVSNVEDALFEENIYDHNGWHEQLQGAEATIYNHNFYVQGDSKDVTLRGNIIARASSHGFQLRPHGLAEENLLIANGIAGFVAGDNPYDGMLQALRRNVLVHAGQHRLYCDDCENNETFRGWGYQMFGIDAAVASAAEAIGNIAVHSGPIAQFAFELEEAVATSGNIVYDWNGASDPGPFLDPSRDIPSYHETLGGDASIEAFLAGARAQRKGHWCAEYTAEEVNAYVRAGLSGP